MKRIIKKLKKANKVMLFFSGISILLYLVSSIIITLSLVKLVGIETFIRYLVIAFLIILLLIFLKLNYGFVVKRKKVKFIIINIISVIISIVLLFGSYMINMLYNSIDGLTEDEKVVYTSYLITLKDTELTDKSKLGMIKDDSDIEGVVLAKEIIKKHKLDQEISYYDSYNNELINALYNKEVDGIFVSGNYITLFEADYPTIKDDTKIVYKYSKKMTNKDLDIKSNKSLEEPFTILLMGVDTDSIEGVKANSSFNGDTLMLISFNPDTLNAIVFSIPRDLYVPISCYGNSLNKINSSAAGGTNCVIETIQNLIGIDIDYYAKINFRGVVDLVDAVEGVDLEVKNKFCEQDSHRNMKNKICLDVGYQHLDGEQALAFSRHRHSLPTGDLMRIQNQQVLVEALTRKLVQINSISEIRDILNAISNNISVNMNTNQILSSYNILKSMVVNTLNGEEALTLNKSYLEVYDKPIYAANGTYSATLGYYQKSLDDIVDNMKINLGINEPVMTKTFNFDANTIYEVNVIGKGIMGTNNRTVMKNFVGKQVNEVEKFCNNNNITLTKEFVTKTSEYYNNNVNLGLVAHQNIKAGTDVTQVSAMTIYINSND